MKFLNTITSFFRKKKKNSEDMKKYLIVGLGNFGEKYANTRHNIGFKILDRLAEKEKIAFETKKLGDIARFRYKGRTFILLKPNTYMNLSGKAVNYWLTIEKIPLENTLVVADDLNLNFGVIRMKSKGSAGGHNGLTHIIELLQTSNFARLRFGVGSEFKKGQQIEHVLGNWSEDEIDQMAERIEKTNRAIISFVLSGIAHTMSEFNGK